VHLILGTVSSDQLDSLLARIESEDAPAAIELTREIISRGISSSYLAHSLAAHVRDRFLKDLSGGDRDHQRRRLELVERLARSEADMRWNASHDLVLELAILKSCVQPVAEGVGSESLSTGPLARKAPVRPAKERTRDALPEELTKAPADDENPTVAGDPALQDLWMKVLDRVKQKGGLPLHAFLMEGRPVAIEEDRLVLVFDQGFEFHRQKVNEPSRRRVVEEILREFSGEFPADVKLDCRLADSSASPTTSETMKSGDLLAQASALFQDSRILE
jgi:hypothetical protein